MKGDGNGSLYPRMRRFIHVIALLVLESTLALAPERRTSRLSRIITQQPAKQYRRLADDASNELVRYREVAADRPTETLTDIPPSATAPQKPKIVVLGASGKVGRLVVRQLLESNLDATIVAFCRDYDKACRVLYDDLLVLASNPMKRGPKLEIVHGDLVAPEELPGYRDKEYDNWLERAESAAKFFKTSVSDYDDDDEVDSSNEALEDAIRGCTAIISCVGSVRPTNIWTDLLSRPFLRLLRKDVSSWCNDCRHPFYVHFASTRKALAFAEREQLRREAAAADADDTTKPSTPVPRIRFVRISDLCVAQQPWHLIPVLTNAMHSMVFRYQDMAEKILEASNVIETVVLRPGDLVDEERDVNTTSLQVGVDGSVPGPARVGRDDVAALAVAAALFDSQRTTSEDDKSDSDPAFHYTLAARWAGQNLDPYPAQGVMSDGLPTAQLCLQSALRTIGRQEKRERRHQKKKEQAYPESILRFARSLPTVNRKSKPYGICVAIPVYLMLSMMAKSFFLAALPYVPGRSWMIPMMNRATNILAAFGALVLRHAISMTSRLPTVLSWLPSRASQKYISF